MSDFSDVTLAVLAGGEGSRMGKAKSELRIEGEPILIWLMEKIKWTGPTMLVTAPGREHPSGFEIFDTEVVDPVAGVGPILGLLTALENARSEFLIVVTVDMPMVRREHLRWVVEAMRAKPQAAGFMCENQIEVQPFPSAWRCEKARTIVLEHFKTGARSVYSLQDHPDVIVTKAQWPESTWLNLNGPEDLDALKKLGVKSAGF